MKTKVILTLITATLFFFNTNEISAQWHGQSNSTWNTIYRYGNVGIYGWPSYKLDVRGSFRAYYVYNTSDERYKKNIANLSGALNTINQLQGVEYEFNPLKYKDEKDIPKGKTIGFLAQDVKEILPQLVSQDNEGIYSVNYIGVIPVLVEGIKEQQEVIVAQRKDIKDLKWRMDKLEALLNNSEIAPNDFPAIRDDAQEIILRQNIPNPFDTFTTIEYQLPEHVDAASLVIYDLNGRTIATYDISGKGSVEFITEKLDSGIYVYAIVANGKNIVNKKMLIQK